MAKLVRLLVLIVLLAAMPLTTLATDSAAARRDPVTVRIFVGLGTGNREDQMVAQDALAEEWNSTHEDIKIAFEYNANNTARDILLTQIAAGNPPDIVGPAGIRSVYETSDLWADLTPYIEADAESVNLADFDEASLALYEIGDKQIAIPLGVYPGMLYVNIDLFEAAEVPLPPTDYNDGQPMYEGELWDMDALQEVALLLTRDANGYYADEEEFDPDLPDVYGFADMWQSFRGWAKHFGVSDSGVAEDGKTAIFNGPEYVTAMQYRQDAIFKYHTHPSDSEGQTLGNPFESGRIALWSSATWYASCCMSGAGFDWTVAVMPVAPNGVMTAAGAADTFAILEDSPNKDAAWEVLNWLTSSEMAGEVCQIYGCLPARLSARDTWEAATRENYPQLNLDVVYGAIPYIDVPNSESYMPNYARAADALNTYWTELNTNPELDIPVWLDQVNAGLQNIFDDAE